MAAPEFVPAAPTTKRHYSSPPQRAGKGGANRPGETFGTPAGEGGRLGAQGPDQGFVYTLTPLFDTKLILTDGEYRGDVDAGCIGVALKRASQFHRAPVVHDLRIAYTLFGFLDENAPKELIEFRKTAFAEVHYSFHYFERRAIADMVSNEVLMQTPDEVATRYRTDWKDQVSTQP